VDRIDLLQHHEVIRFDDPDRIFAEGGAMEAVVAAKKAGKVRLIGYTGHKDPRIHLSMLEVADRHGFHFDTVQMPINIMDAHFRSFAQLVVPQALKRNTAVLGMKCFGGRRNSEERRGAAGGLPQLLAERAGVSADYGHQFAHAAQPGIRGSEKFQAHG